MLTGILIYNRIDSFILSTVLCNHYSSHPLPGIWIPEKPVWSSEYGMVSKEAEQNKVLGLVWRVAYPGCAKSRELLSLYF